MKKPRHLNYKIPYAHYLDEVSAEVQTDEFGPHVIIGPFHFGLSPAKALHGWLGRAIKYMEQRRTRRRRGVGENR